MRPLTKHTFLSQLDAMLPWRMLLLSLLVAITALALAPAVPASVGTGSDKLNHVVAFAALAAAACRGFAGSARRTLLVLAAVLTFGVLIEFLQWLGGSRSGERADLLADAIGTGLGALFARVVWKRGTRDA